MTTVEAPLIPILTFLWIGFVCAISFMEAWLKFRAPGLTLAVGLGIGKIIFNALNKVEWAFVAAIIGASLFTGVQLFSLLNLLYFIPLMLLIMQTVWVLPKLDKRADLHIQNKTVPRSRLHFYYVAMEIAKVVSLTMFGISHFKSTTL